MKIAKTWFIVCLLLASMIIGVIPVGRADNLDSFGYTYKDSNTPGGPSYNWIEISSAETLIMPVQPFDDFYGPQNWMNNIDIGFEFLYYDQEYNQLSVHQNGLFLFGSVDYYVNSYLWSNQPIGESTTIDGFIAPYWDGLSYDYWTYPIIKAGVYCQTIGSAPNRLFVVEWQGLLYSAFNTTTSEGITFEAILYEGSNKIQFQYQKTSYGIVSPNANGGSATIGIEDPSGNIGLEYSFNQQVLSEGLAIEFFCPEVLSEPNLYVSINGPPRTSAFEAGEIITYSLSYCNLGGSAVTQATLQANLSQAADLIAFLSASEGGIYNPDSEQVTWDIGLLDAYPSGYGSKTITVELPTTIEASEFIIIAAILSNAPEIDYSDNTASVLTQVAGLNLPENVEVQSYNLNIDYAGTPIVQNIQSTTFTYTDPLAIAVDITINLSDGGPEITGIMTGPAPTWTYTLTFGSRNGLAAVDFTAHYLVNEEEVTEVVASASVEVVRVDPAGYIYDVATGARIAGATVWLQMPNGRGGWINVPIGEDPATAIADPNVNPQTTGADGRYQWDTLPGTYRVKVQAPGYYSADSIAVTVPPPVTELHVGLTKIPLPLDNFPPVIQAIIAPEYPVQINSPISFSASFTDSNVLDTHSAIWVWSDGFTSKGILKETKGVGTVSGSHIYANAGVYAVTLRVFDNNGGSSEVLSEQYVVVYDPNAGFVTGGGWINSPEGAFYADSTLTGKAVFGFVSKYQKGANIPTGKTQFQFKAADMNFQSTSYDWMVVAGTKAQFKGLGTINGEGEYSFMLTANDGASLNRVDTFRIKIWDKATDSIIYDNQLDALDSENPTTTIGGGSIVVHK